MGMFSSGSKTQPVPTAVLAATPRAVNEGVETVTPKRKRKAYGIDDTYMRAFAEAASQGANTLGGV